jgi:REP element-mobilizing transposase RayT
LLADAKIHARLIDFARRGERHRAWLGDYVLMPDHLHLFVALDETRIRLSTWMKSLKNSLSMILREKDIPPPHWQKGFFDHLLRGDESYAEKWNYVQQNPVRAGLVTRADEWPFIGRVFALELRD